jgi:homopolymeric O-antigen transport system permease protein
MFERIKEIWSYRGLIRTLVIRDLKVRYKSSFLGYLWSFIKPLALMIVLSIVFSFVLKMQADGPFPLFMIIGLMPWIFAATSLMEGTVSIVGNADLVRKIYFPREIYPITAVLANLVHFVFTMPLLLGLLVFYSITQGIPITWPILIVPAIVFVQILFLIGVCMPLAALNTYYRDTSHIVEVIINIWFYLTPIVYPLAYIQKNVFLDLGIADIFKRALLWLYQANPMAGFIMAYRYAFMHGVQPNNPELGGYPFLWPYVISTLVITVLSLVIGFKIFQRYDDRIADEI